MYKKILIATDGSEFAKEAVKHGIGLAKSTGASITVVTVTELWSAIDMAHKSKVGIKDPINEYEKAAAALADKVLAAVEAMAKKANVACDSIHIKDKHPAEGIIETAKKKRCDLIVMASHGRRGIQKMLLGSIAAEVITQSKIPVMIIK